MPPSPPSPAQLRMTPHALPRTSGTLPAGEVRWLARGFQAGPARPAANRHERAQVVFGQLHPLPGLFRTCGQVK